MRKRYTTIAIFLLVTACGAPVAPPTPAPASAAASNAAAPGAQPPPASDLDQSANLPDAPAYEPPPPRPVVSVDIEPANSQPPPIAVGWAPPPMLVQFPPPQPSAAAAWIGGYWVWEGNWVWAHGRWAPPPRPHYQWVNPYYENRAGSVIFIDGHWSPPGIAFVPPAPGLHLTLEITGRGVLPGLPPTGPSGAFVPAPPGSRFGVIVPAPVGTAPAVVTSAPPVIAAGMHVNTTAANIRSVTRSARVAAVTIVAPANATASGREVNISVPAQAHLAAALPPVVKIQAPAPASAKPLQAFVHGRPAPALPPSQPVRVENAPRATESARVAPPPSRSKVGASSAAVAAAVGSAPGPAPHPPITLEPAKPQPAPSAITSASAKARSAQSKKREGTDMSDSEREHRQQTD